MNTKENKQFQNEAVHQIKKTIPQKERISALLNTIASLGLSVISAILAVQENAPTWIVILILLFSITALFGVILAFRAFHKIKQFQDDYNYYEASKKVSTALLTAIKRIQFDKTSYILQSTYEKVPNWRPINYNDNILVYDVHEHLRKICIRFKELVVSLAPGELNDDKVTVDIAYRYPSDDKFVSLQTGNYSKLSSEDALSSNDSIGFSENEAPEAKAIAPKTSWKIITSGDHTSSHVVLQEFLESDNSFYHYHINLIHDLIN